MSYVLPGITLGIHHGGRLFQLVRSATLDELGKSYVTVAQSKGLATWPWSTRHILRNISVVVATMVGWEYARMWGGTVFLVEFTFAWPGIGKLVTDAARVHDFPVIQAGVRRRRDLRGLANLFVDLLSHRSRQARGGRRDGELGRRRRRRSARSRAQRAVDTACAVAGRGGIWVAVSRPASSCSPCSTTWIAPFDHTEQNVEVEVPRPAVDERRRASTCSGTDELGRDVFSKVIVGARLTLVHRRHEHAHRRRHRQRRSGCSPATRAAASTGSCMRLTEAQTAMPMFLVALLLLSSLGASVVNLIIILPTLRVADVRPADPRRDAAHALDAVHRGGGRRRMHARGRSSAATCCPTWAGRVVVLRRSASARSSWPRRGCRSSAPACRPPT